MKTQKCIRCGAENAENNNFCQNCGYELHVENVKSQTRNSTPVADVEYKTLPRLGFKESVKLAFKNRLNFSGRSRRSEYWWFQLFLIIIMPFLFLNAYISIRCFNSDSVSTWRYFADFTFVDELVELSDYAHFLYQSESDKEQEYLELRYEDDYSEMPYNIERDEYQYNNFAKIAELADRKQIVVSIAIVLIFLEIFFNIALSVRRLHDINHSGLWWIMTFIPGIGNFFYIILLVFCCKDSDRVVNKYGESPKYIA